MPRKRILTNNHNIPTSMAVWLANDDYDYNDDEDYISATSLLKSTRQLILMGRLEKSDAPMTIDVNQLVASAIGNAVHDSVERVWVSGKYKNCLELLQIPLQVIERIVINPVKRLLTGQIPMRFELRNTRTINGHTIGGKFDINADGVVEDIKTTSVYSFTSGNNHWKYQMQGSIYRWLNPDTITKPYMRINFVFLDWKPYEFMARRNNGYPPTRVYGHKINLLSMEETERFIVNKLSEIDRCKDAPEPELPLCNARELWQDAPKFKYYKNPKATGRSTKNFDTMAEASTHKAKNGGVGRIDTVPGAVGACKYCDAFQICSQKDELIRTGLLKLE